MTISVWLISANVNPYLYFQKGPFSVLTAYQQYCLAVEKTLEGD